MSRSHIHRGSFSPLLAWCTLAVCGCVTSGTLLPFRFDTPAAGASDLFGLARVGWPASTVDDLVTNVAIYIPIGLMLSLLLGRHMRSNARRILFVTAAGLSMSLGLEWLQTMMSSRYASWMDVCMNGLGTLLGATGAVLVGSLGSIQDRLERYARLRPWSAATAALTIGLMAYHLVPFDFVGSSLAMRRSLAQTNLWPIAGTAATDLSSVDEWVRMLGYASPFGLLAFVGVLGRCERGMSGAVSRRALLTGVALVPLALEVVQIFVASHAFDAMDWLSGAMGGAIGAIVGCRLCAGGRSVSTKSVFAGAVLLQVPYLLVSSATSLDLAWSDVALSRLVWMPFAGHFARPFAPAMADLIATAITFVVFAGLIRGLWGGRDRIQRAVFIMLPVVAIASICEMMQMFASSRTPDVTTPLIAMMAAVVVVLWEPGSFRPTPVATNLASTDTFLGD